MWKKKAFCGLVAQARDMVPSFEKGYRKFERQVVLKGLSKGLLTNYGRNVAQISLHFGRCPELVSVEEINRYRTTVAVTTTVRNVANHPKKRLKDLAVTQKISISNRRLKSMDNGGLKRI